MGKEGGHAAVGLVASIEAAQINVKDDVSAEKEEVLPQLVLQKIQRAGGAERLRLRRPPGPARAADRL